jgi:hypothetical protein
MRWDTLFADLEAQAEALERVARAGEISDRTRGELAGITLFDRLRAGLGVPVRVGLSGGADCVGTLRRVGPDWLLVADDAGRESVIVLAAVTTLRGLGRAAAVPGTAGAVQSRLGLGSVLRVVAQDRLAVRLELRSGTTIDATLDRVGADFVEVAVHEPGEPRRARAVRDWELVPFSAVAAIRRVIGDPPG